MAQFNLDSYEFVADRIDRFYKDHPEGRIITSIVSPIPEAKEWVIFQAAIFDGLVQLSTGVCHGNIRRWPRQPNFSR